jgi:hypothetical protein
LKKEMPARNAREYLKTSRIISEDPWRMHAASKYLNELVENSKTPVDADSLPTLDCITHGSRDFEAALPHSFLEWHQAFAPKTPKVVSLEVITKKRRITEKSHPEARGPKRPKRAAQAVRPSAGEAPEHPEGPAAKKQKKAAQAVRPAALAGEVIGPKLGCSKCRHSAKGCKQCKARVAKQADEGEAVAAVGLVDAAVEAEGEAEAAVEAEGEAEADEGAVQQIIETPLLCIAWIQIQPSGIAMSLRFV